MLFNKKINNPFSQNIGSPFWQKPLDGSSKKKELTKKILKIILKWTKILIYAFLLLMGLWGCFQTTIEPETKTDIILGRGLEFGYIWGTTNDWRYDLFSSSTTSQYYTFVDWGFNYGPFYAFFVWPGAKLVLEMMYPIRDWWGGLNALVSIFVLLFLIRGITLLISIRSTMQSERMSEVQGKIAEINAKYKDVKDPASRQKKQQETSELYKKYKIKPFAMFEQIFITLPIFLIVYRVVTILRPIKATVLFDIWELGKTPLNEVLQNLTNGGWKYIIFLAIVVPTQFVSQKMSQWLSKKRNKNNPRPLGKPDGQNKKMKIMQTVMTVILIFVVVSSPAGIGLYWFLSSIFSIIQSWLIHLLIIKKKKKGTSLEDKLRLLGI